MPVTVLVLKYTKTSQKVVTPKNLSVRGVFHFNPTGLIPTAI